jgi:serine/threonine protein kinase
MEKLVIKGDTILWSSGNYNWLLSFDELTKAFLAGKHPYTKQQLSPTSIFKILRIINALTGKWWIVLLKMIKNYKKIPVVKLTKLKKGDRLGSGKYATVYAYNKYAIKVVEHKFYRHLPPSDGSFEAKIMMLLKNKLLYSYRTPNIITMFQYIPTEKTDYLVMEKLDTTFWSYIRNNLDDHIIKAIILQVLFTLLIIQNTIPGFRHNDLKIDNILLDVTPRKKDITLRYKTFLWKLPKNIPLVKIADFDYASVSNIIKNPKVGTPFAKTFGCTDKPSKIYDEHIFLNSIYSCRKRLSPQIVTWLEQQLPILTRGNDNAGVKVGRLKNPEKWNGHIKTPFKILTSKFFNTFRTTKVVEPVWGIK